LKYVLEQLCQHFRHEGNPILRSFGIWRFVPWVERWWQRLLRAVSPVFLLFLMFPPKLVPGLVELFSEPDDSYRCPHCDYAYCDSLPNTRDKHDSPCGYCNIPTRVHRVNRLVFAIQIRMLTQRRVPADEPTYLRVVISGTNVQ